MNDLAVDRYLKLLIECVNGSVYGQPTQLVPTATAGWRRKINRALAKRGLTIAREETIAASVFEGGEGWPVQRWNSGESMVGRARLTQIREALTTVVDENIPGHFIETGVWRGGSCIVAKGVLDVIGDGTRKVYVADSFEGLPATDASDDAADLHLDSTLAVSQEEVTAAFRRYGLLDENVVFVKGWFRDTLPRLDEQWSVVRLDGDMYESTMDGIANLYPRLSPGGFLIIDDYNAYESCRRAISDYRDEHRISDEIVRIDEIGAYWRKS